MLNVLLLHVLYVIQPWTAPVRVQCHQSLFRAIALARASATTPHVTRNKKRFQYCYSVML